MASGRQFELDLLRVTAILAVIIIHSDSFYFWKPASVPHVDWYIASLFDGLFRWCVDAFLLLTGALLLGKNEPIRKVLNRTYGILIPFIAWSLIYATWKHYTENHAFTISEMLLKRQGVMFHLWFMYLIITLYLLLPLYRRFVQNASESEIRYFLIMWFTVTSVSWGLGHFGLSMPFYFEYISGYFGLPILGYWLSKQPTHRRLLMVSIFIFILSTVITIAGTWFTSDLDSGRPATKFLGYTTPHVILASAAIFYLFKSFSFKPNTRTSSLITTISLLTFDIYLSHVFIRAVGMKTFDFTPMAIGDAWYSIPLYALTIFVTSLLLSAFLRFSFEQLKIFLFSKLKSRSRHGDTLTSKR